MLLTAKRAAFIDAYFESSMNATEAYLRVYPKATYESARRLASQLLTNVDIREAINNRLAEKHMSADEVLSRLADMARSDVAMFAKLNDPRELQEVNYKGKSHVIKKIKKNVTRTKDGSEYMNFELELYDAQSALINIGKQHGLFSDRHIIETKVEKELDTILATLEEELSADDFQRVLLRLTSGQAGSSEVATEPTD